jgi:hypothetical protein
MNRREFLRLTAGGLCLSAAFPFAAQAQEGPAQQNPLFWITGIPKELSGNYHPGIDRLLVLMGNNDRD